MIIANDDSHCYHWAIACEKRPTGVFDAWSSQEVPKHGVAPLPESPLFRQTAGLNSACKSPNCSEITAKILNWMANLTDLFIAGNTDATSASDIKLEDQGRGSQCLINFHYQATEIGRQLTSLDSAYKPDLETSDDWVYEACRIAALIYVTALIDRSPFFLAARSSWFRSSPSSGSVADAQANAQDSSSSLIEALF